METKTRTTGIVCALTLTAALGLLSGCAETQQGAPAHATTAALLREADDAEPHKTSVRLVLDAAEDPVLVHAFDVVERTLVEQGFIVSPAPVGFDAELVLGVRRDFTGTHVALTARLPNEGRVMLPVVLDALGDASAVDEEALADLATRWQRRFNRSPRLERHFEH